MDHFKLSTELSHIVRTQFVECTEKLISDGADINFVDHNGISIINHAIGAKQWSQVSVLKKHGMNTSQLQTVLFKAVAAKDLDTVKFCVDECGIDPNSLDSSASHIAYMSDGYTPLCFAIYNNVPELFFYLINHPKININATSVYKRTPLRIACFYGHIFYVRRLLESGANLKIYCADNIDALSRSIVTKHSECAILLLGYCDSDDINHQAEFGKTAIMEAVEYKLANVVQMLVYLGADLSIESKICGYTVFDYAKNNGFLETLEKIVKMHDIDLKYKSVPKLTESAEKIYDKVGTILSDGDIVIGKVECHKDRSSDDNLTVCATIPKPSEFSESSEPMLVLGVNANTSNDVPTIINSLNFLYKQDKETYYDICQGTFSIINYPINSHHFHPTTKEPIKIIDNRIKY